MKKLFSLMAMAILVTSVLPMVFAAGIGTGIGGDIDVEVFEPIVWQCGERVLWDDDVQPWRITDLHDELFERSQQYLFEGEKYQVDVVVFDKNKIDDVTVDLTLTGQEIQICVPSSDSEEPCVAETIPASTVSENCEPISHYEGFDDCNARIDEEVLDWYDKDTMQAYSCTIDILDSETMYGLTEMNVLVTSALNGEEEFPGYAEIARWYINPMISLDISGDLEFESEDGDGIRPGTYAYSTVFLENNAQGGVLLDMFITGDNWPTTDTDPLGRCQLVDGYGDPHNGLVNYLPLGAFRYYAENGAYSTRDDAGTDFNNYDPLVQRDVDVEGYVNIQRQLNTGFQEEMFDEAEILQAGNSINGAGYAANVLYPGSAGMALTFRLDLPEPCYGNFAAPSGEGRSGFYIWGEAI